MCHDLTTGCDPYDMVACQEGRGCSFLHLPTTSEQTCFEKNIVHFWCFPLSSSLKFVDRSTPGHHNILKVPTLTPAVVKHHPLAGS